MNKLIWASPHKPTTEQLAELSAKGNVVYLVEKNPDLFNQISSLKIDTDLEALASDLISSLNEDDILVQPAGSPKFHMTLGRKLVDSPIKVLFAFSQRVSVDEEQADGTVIKRVVFKHEGFI